MRFTFPDLPKEETDAVLIQPSRLIAIKIGKASKDSALLPYMSEYECANGSIHRIDQCECEWHELTKNFAVPSQIGSKKYIHPPPPLAFA